MKRKAQDTRIGKYVIGKGNDILYDDGICLCFAIGLKDNGGNGFFSHIGPNFFGVDVKDLRKQLEKFNTQKDNIEAIIGGPKNPEYKKGWKIFKKELKKYGCRNIHEIKYDTIFPKIIEFHLKKFRFDVTYE